MSTEVEIFNAWCDKEIAKHGKQGDFVILDAASVKAAQHAIEQQLVAKYDAKYSSDNGFILDVIS
jgi:hypothetical protein